MNGLHNNIIVDMEYRIKEGRRTETSSSIIGCPDRLLGSAITKE